MSAGEDSGKSGGKAILLHLSDMNLGDLYLEWGELDKAQEHAERALAFLQTTYR